MTRGLAGTSVDKMTKPDAGPITTEIEKVVNQRPGNRRPARGHAYHDMWCLRFAALPRGIWPSNTPPCMGEGRPAVGFRAGSRQAPGPLKVERESQTGSLGLLYHWPIRRRSGGGFPKREPRCKPRSMFTAAGPRPRDPCSSFPSASQSINCNGFWKQCLLK